ncbi:MAG: lyase domain protein repeat-containing protein [Gemmatimonadetes bacterium]|nr:lyase domain protein repeat-containing protein [Gemmatimonadota bacterium]
MKRLLIALALTPALLRAQQSLGTRVRSAGTRTIAFEVRPRAETCGDGTQSYSDGLSGPRTRVFDGMLLTYAPWDTHIAPCEKGPMRVTVRVVEGVPSWLRTAVGPVPVLGDTVQDFGTVSTSEAGEFLRTLALTSLSRTATQALTPLVLLDSFPRWDVLAVAARDSTRQVGYRRRAADFLARAAAGTLGTAQSDDDDASGTRREAVYALARQREKSQDPVPQLLEIATKNAHRDARVAALYQLGQLGDPRAVALFTSMLLGR